MNSILRFSSVAAATLAALSLALPASARQTLGCTTGGAGGAFPTNGTGDGAFPTTLPTYPLVTSQNVVSLPPGATVVTEVKMHAMFHTFVGDVQFVLQDPAGNKYNVFCRPGFACDYGGDYTFIGPCGGGLGIPTTCATTFPPGIYEQDFGTWPSGTNGIANTSLYSIPAATGSWTLYCYDWAAIDVGSLSTWDICFGTAPVLPIPGTPALTSPADGTTVSSPAQLTWSAANCSTTYDVDVDGTVTSGLAATNYSAVASAGPHTWRVRAENGSGPGPWTASWTFNCPTPPPPSVCVSGGAGGGFPTAGSGDGTWPGTMPSAPLDAPLAVTLPAGATKIVRVKLNGMTHTYIGDTHFVLEAPTGSKYNLLHRPGFTGLCCGCYDDWGGDYSIYENSGLPLPACSGLVVPSGDYVQDFGSGGGLWPSGTNGITNTLMSAIPIVSGVWILHVYDWAGGDVGNLTSWELCFDAPSGPTSYCTAGTSTNGCVPAISASAQPSVTLAHACNISIANVEGQKFGIVFYGVNNTGFNPTPWANGSNSFLCVKGPTQRTGTGNSGGTITQCNGTLSLNWNAYQTANPSSVGNPFSAGNHVYVQGWYRDPPAPKTTNLTNALDMTMTP